MNYTDKEIKNIKDHAFDKGWRYGATTIFVVCTVINILLTWYLFKN